MEGALQKSPDAFRTISEVADDLDIPKHVLRFWEGKFAQLRPMKRGGGRRYYRPEDVELLRGIRQLLYEDGYTIKGVQKILREQGVRFVMDVWQEDGEGPGREIPDVAAEARSAVVVTRPSREPSGSVRVKDLAAVLGELEACQELLTEAKR